MVVDLSHHNAVGGNGPALAGFQQMRAAGVVGVIHKATQGSQLVDGRYAPRRPAALDAGLLWGAYHFADNSDVVAQATHFLSIAKPDGKTLVALDWEPNGEHTMSADQARKWLAFVAAKIGRKPVLYSGNLAKEVLGNKLDPFFGSHRLWLAQYSESWKVQNSWRNPWLWQYAENGAVPGIDGAVDHNAYDGTPEELAEDWAT
jgi:GH25 family lysozyme M1 (1,4-beta-N-acetylmuramidase)